ncbi:hypothetical protein [Gaiella sp.]|jgi:hypothetical protein|uniref:hypothetical protein n=1 Tax=Gaiella sp. TaxID=2663207 RepID=UPI002E333AA4|nr:hypothetical protein [Gaiella sp.]HEX5583485.1 hypothetical protein [Gaiella sp.]
MRHEGVVRVKWTREELKAVREALEITPNFEGRLEAREVVKVALRTPRMRDVTIDLDLAQRLGSRIVPIDAPTAMARAKLLLAVRGPRKRGIAETMQAAHRPPAYAPPLSAPPMPAPSIAASAAA